MDRDDFSGTRPDWLTQAKKVAPLYRVVGGGEPRPTGWGSGSADSALIHQQTDDDVFVEVEVEVSTEPNPADDFREHTLFQAWLSRVIPFPVSLPISLAAERWQESVLVDGAAVSFVFIGAPDCWAAGAMLVDRRWVQVIGRGLPAEGLALELLDPHTIAT